MKSIKRIADNRLLGTCRPYDVGFIPSYMATVAWSEFESLGLHRLGALEDGYWGHNTILSAPAHESVFNTLETI